MTVVDVTGGVLGGCCQVRVTASLSSCATATTLEGHEGTPTSEESGKVFIHDGYGWVCACMCSSFLQL